MVQPWDLLGKDRFSKEANRNPLYCSRREGKSSPSSNGIAHRKRTVEETCFCNVTSFPKILSSWTITSYTNCPPPHGYAPVAKNPWQSSFKAIKHDNTTTLTLSIVTYISLELEIFLTCHQFILISHTLTNLFFCSSLLR